MLLKDYTKPWREQTRGTKTVWRAAHARYARGSGPVTANERRDQLSANPCGYKNQFYESMKAIFINYHEFYIIILKQTLLHFYHYFV